ncbi:hypothetical protein FBY58_0275 [Zymomonas mobilis]|uniref:Uncharacterized protein n=1 Tax=Zymomonas mobilis TaxID=542 RepID=A0A542VZH8_ZYMMB|nr:hypothetical protein FBY58_0275 [Zymomonas mobilis]
MWILRLSEKEKILAEVCGYIYMLKKAFFRFLQLTDVNFYKFIQLDLNFSDFLDIFVFLVSDL